MPAGRKLRLKERAARMAETRQRIARAAYELHCTVGPAQTSISAIAERAGVQRLTVYRHFPNERALYQACTAYGLAVSPLPDPDSWRQIADPELRLRHGLAEVYAFYRQNAALLSNAQRDAPFVAERLAGDPPEAVATFMAWPGHLHDALADGWGPVGKQPRLCAVLDLALEFQTWRTLVQHSGLGDTDAIELLVCLARCAAARAPARPERGT